MGKEFHSKKSVPVSDSTIDRANNEANKAPIDWAQVKASYRKATQYIRSQFNQGWWPYTAGHTASTEATAWCSIALRNDDHIIENTLGYLANTQRKDGGWTTAPHSGTSDWTTALAILAIRTLTRSSGVTPKIERCLNRGLDFLFCNRTDIYKPIGRLLLFLVKGPDVLQYAKGWPWTSGCFHWVEPTSYSLLSLKSPHLPEKKVFLEVVKHANAFLIEHVCKGGGWNHGNQLCLGVHLPPYITTTAEALLALQDAKTEKAVKESIAYLRKTVHEQPTAMSLAWSALAFDAHGYAPIREVSRLVKLQHKDGSFGRDLMVTAVACVALGIYLDGNPFLYE